MFKPIAVQCVFYIWSIQPLTRALQFVFWNRFIDASRRRCFVNLCLLSIHWSSLFQLLHNLTITQFLPVDKWMWFDENVCLNKNKYCFQNHANRFQAKIDHNDFCLHDYFCSKQNPKILSIKCCAVTFRLEACKLNWSTVIKEHTIAKYDTFNTQFVWFSFSFYRTNTPNRSSINFIEITCDRTYLPWFLWFVFALLVASVSHSVALLTSNLVALLHHFIGVCINSNDSCEKCLETKQYQTQQNAPIFLPKSTKNQL